MPTTPSPQGKNRKRTSNWRAVRMPALGHGVEEQLQQRYSLRWHGMCIGALTLIGMLSTAWALRIMGVDMLSMRYAITLAVGYGIYLLVLRFWAAQLLSPDRSSRDDDSNYDGVDATLDATDVAMDVLDGAQSLSRARSTGQIPVPKAGGDGMHLGDLSDGAEAAKGLGELAGGALEGLGSADEGAVVVIPVVAIFIIGAAIVAGSGALAMLFFGWDVLLAVAVELAFSLAAVRAATGVEREGWLQAAVRLTWKPLLGALVCAVALGATIDHFMPQVNSLPEAVRLMRG